MAENRRQGGNRQTGNRGKSPFSAINASQIAKHSSEVPADSIDLPHLT
jgi:hypothetical protein